MAFVSEDNREIEPLQIPGNAHSDTDSDSFTEPLAKRYADACAWAGTSSQPHTNSVLSFFNSEIGNEVSYGQVWEEGAKES